MNSADEMAAKLEPELIVAGAGSDHTFGERAPANDPPHANDRLRPVEDLHSLLLRISHHLDYETSERSTIYYRLLAIDGQTKRIENQTKRRAWRALPRYLVAICIGVAGVLAWQSYGDATKQFIALKAPELGWSPQAKQMIAGWIQQIGWTKPPADGQAGVQAGFQAGVQTGVQTGVQVTAIRAPAADTPQAANVAPAGAEASAPKTPIAPAIDPEQVQQITRNLTALQQSVEQIAAGQDQMAREITKLQAADSEILQKIPAPPPPPQHAAGPPAHKPIPLPPARTPAR
jgi:hypothetical protein